MVLSECIYIRKTKELMDMLSSVTEVYNKTLYLLRKSYFEQLDKGEKIKLPTNKEVYDTITKEECWKTADYANKISLHEKQITTEQYSK